MKQYNFWGDSFIKTLIYVQFAEELKITIMVTVELGGTLNKEMKNKLQK